MVVVGWGRRCFGSRLGAFCRLKLSPLWGPRVLFPAALLFPRGSPSCLGLFSPDSSFSVCVTEVLNTRKREFEQLEEQKQQRRSLLRLCRGIEEAVTGTGWVNGATSEVLEWGDVS